MSITFKPASREKLGLIIACIGGTGSGKTLSALLIARGLCNGDDSKIAVIDTEAGRSLHYAPTAGEKPGPFTFGFHHGDMQPPFTPEAYTDAILDAERAGFLAVVVDSGSHEYAGEGGLDDIHEAELDRMAGEDDGKRERLSVMAWKVPKRRHKKFVARLLQCRAHVILCLRAEEKMKISKVQDGAFKKTVITAAEDRPLIERWVPLTEKRLPFELTTSLLFTADRPGVPVPIKMESQFRDFIPLDVPITAETGRKMAEWAHGGTPAAAGPAGPVYENLPSNWAEWSDQERGDNRALAGTEAFRQWWKTLGKEQRAYFSAAQINEWKEIAAKKDAS